MIMGGIEYTLGSLIISLYCHLLQLLIPSVGTHIHHLIKIPVSKFGLQVHRCVVTADRRKSDFYLHFFHVAKSKDTLHRCHFQLVPRLRGIIIIGSKLLYLLITFQHKINFAGRTPASHIAIPLYRIIIYLTDIAVVSIRSVSFT